MYLSLVIVAIYHRHHRDRARGRLKHCPFNAGRMEEFSLCIDHRAALNGL